MLYDDISHQPSSCWHLLHGVDMLLEKNVQLSPAKPFSNSRSLFLIFAKWRLRGVLDPRKHNSAPAKYRKRHFSYYPRYCCCVRLAFLDRYKFGQSAMISATFVCHSACYGKYKRRKCPMLYLHYP